MRLIAFLCRWYTWLQYRVQGRQVPWDQKVDWT